MNELITFITFLAVFIFSGLVMFVGIGCIVFMIIDDNLEKKDKNKKRR